MGYILCVMPKQKYRSADRENMDPAEIRAFMEMHGYPFGFSISPFSGLRYPPALAGPMTMNPAKAKEKMVAENSTFTVKLHEFNKMYLKHASGLMDMSSSMFAPGHPLSHKMATDYAAKEENERLRMENAELKKRIEHYKAEKKA